MRICCWWWRPSKRPLARPLIRVGFLSSRRVRRLGRGRKSGCKSGFGGHSMSFNFVPLFVAWGLLALVVLGLFIWRKNVASNEDDTLHVMHGALTQQTALADKLDMIDKWGKILTVVAGVL